LSEVELLRSISGNPILKLSGNALKIAQVRKINFAVSVTHTRLYAAVIVIGEEAIQNEGT